MLIKTRAQRLLAVDIKSLLLSLEVRNSSYCDALADLRRFCERNNYNRDLKITLDAWQRVGNFETYYLSMPNKRYSNLGLIEMLKYVYSISKYLSKEVEEDRFRKISSKLMDWENI